MPFNKADNSVDAVACLSYHIEHDSMGPPCPASTEDWVRWGCQFLGLTFLRGNPWFDLVVESVDIDSQDGADADELAIIITALLLKGERLGYAEVVGQTA